MSPHKEFSNLLMAVKAEPVESTVPLLSSSDAGKPVKTEEQPSLSELNKTVGDVEMTDMTFQKKATYTVYNNAEDISYTPEDALKQGSYMVDEIMTNIRNIKLGSKMRSEVWLREIGELKNQAAPQSLIAVCGSTGSGKSSVLNAVLDDQVVPTSGMRACTAVVTQIAYHDKATIVADISFLTETEWIQELKILLEELVDEDGVLKRTVDLKSDAGIAWSKVHALHPTISQEKIITMSPGQIIAHDPTIAAILGQTKHVQASDSKIFAKKIGKYIDSKNQKRGKRDEKTPEERKKEVERPALWPLIRQVNVRCNSKALSTGCILIDLPGTGDSNAARNSIAKDFIKKADCLWIVAPITRAVDDKTARDLLGEAFKLQLLNGNYDDHAITFVASKTDDVSCGEIIESLQLDDDEELLAIEDTLSKCRDESIAWKAEKKQAEKTIKQLEVMMKTNRALSKEYNEHIDALKEGISFTPTLTSSHKGEASKKRKSSGGGKKASPKRRRRNDSDHDSDSNSDSANDDSDSEIEIDSDADSDFNGNSNSDVETIDSYVEHEDEGEVTVASLKEKNDACKKIIKETRAQVTELRQTKNKASEHLAQIDKKSQFAQRHKNAFCSLKRSEFSQDVLKEDFRTGLKESDDIATEERNPGSFDPTVNLRDYANINLPVFTVSSRDYIRLTGQIQGDGKPTCFSNVDDTGIPSLQSWCHQLTISSRERAARSFFVRLHAFTASIKGYVQGVENVTEADRNDLRLRWESFNENSEMLASDDDDEMPVWLYAIGQEATPKLSSFGNPVGIVSRLTKDFREIVNSTVLDLQAKFRDGLEDKCVAGAAKAADVAVEHSDSFAGSMHWGTSGEWRRDLNAELIMPFTKNIAHSWSSVFDSDLLGPFQAAANLVISSLLKDVEDSAASGLKDRVKLQSEISLVEARVALEEVKEVVGNAMQSEQREISRCLSPHVQSQLMFAYERAMLESGLGSVARQKACFHKDLSESRHEIFDGGADILLERLEKSAEAVGVALHESLENIAQKIEVGISSLWDNVPADRAQIAARKSIVSLVETISQQVEIWQKAAAQK